MLPYTSRTAATLGNSALILPLSSKESGAGVNGGGSVLMTRQNDSPRYFYSPSHASAAGEVPRYTSSSFHYPSLSHVEHNLSDEASSNCSSTLTDQQQHKQSPPPLIAEHQPESSSAVSSANRTAAMIPTSAAALYHTYTSSPNKFRQPGGHFSQSDCGDQVANQSYPNEDSRGTPSGTPIAPVKHLSREGTIEDTNDLNTSSAGVFCNDNSSSANSPSSHMHDPSACSCLQSPWRYRQDHVSHEGL